jgi:acyl-[acyl-carrier-protein]-phospholipid O-acyltransferase/long-chain-fatty-acid--[acyl-carrier-protein] ligase
MVRLLPARLVKLFFCRARDPSKTAAILFSSGSEGAPKGINLSHHNILGNLKQISDVLNLQSNDVVMASLPLFHAFGLTVNQFMPLIEGAPMICHADPTDAVGSAKAIAQYRATILCGTSTFLRMYIKNRRVHPLMLESLRLVVAGAEKLSDDVRQSFRLKFGKEIYEGYGATETTPVASTNLPDQLDSSYWEVHLGQKIGTVGMPLPGTSFKIVDPDTMQELPTGEDGMILIGGCQVMLGYLNNPEKTAEVITEIDGVRWYKSGDKGHLDNDGFLTIVDRYSRFAKLAGEKISLGAVEAEVRKVLDNPEMEIMAATLPDERKGEKIVLLTVAEVNRSELTHKMIQGGCNPLMVPSVIYQVEQLPVLGSGKADFKQAQKLVAELAAR